MTGTTIIFETFLAPACYKTYLTITEYLECALKVPTFLLNGEALEDFGEGHADAGFLSSDASLQLLRQRPCPVEIVAASLREGSEEQGTCIACSTVIVHSESGLTSLDDIENAVWAYQAGITHVEDHFKYQQGPHFTGFRGTVETDSPAQALRCILNGKAEATAIDSRLLSLVLRNSPRIAQQLRILGTYSYALSPLVVVASHISPFLKRRIQEVLVALHQDPCCAQSLREGQIERFIPITNTQYQRMHEQARQTHEHALFAGQKVERETQIS